VRKNIKKISVSRNIIIIILDFENEHPSHLNGERERDTGPKTGLNKKEMLWPEIRHRHSKVKKK
jgi:hypothetical protein